MRRSLFSLLIRTRFTWYYLMIIGVIALYSIYQIPFQISLAGYGYSSLYFTGIFGVFSVTSAILGGITISKSDQEYLLMSAVPKRQLAVSFLLVQLLSSGLLLLAISVIALSVAFRDSLTLLLSLVNLALLDIFVSTIGIASFRYSRKTRVLIAAGIAAWVLMFFLKFPYAPQAFMEGDALKPLILTVPISLASLAGSVIVLSSEELPFKVTLQKGVKREFSSSTKFAGYSPRRAIFMYGFTSLAVSTNTLMAGGIKTTTSKIRLRTYYVVMVAVAAVYALIAFYVHKIGGESIGFNLAVIFGTVYAGIIPQFAFNSGTMPHERAWLSFTSLEPWRYLSIITLSKLFQSFLTSIPFAMANGILYSLGVKDVISSAIVFLFLDPILIGLYLSLSFSISSYQVKEEGFLSSRMTATQFAFGLPIIVFTVAVFIAMFLPASIIFIIIGSGLILVYFLTRKSYWDRRVSRLVERGFV